MDSPDRKSFLAEFGPGRKYENTVAIYRENDSAKQLGVFDKELIDGLPSSVKWIAHNGAGYDPVDVHACIAKGNILLFNLLVRQDSDLALQVSIYPIHPEP